MIGGGIIKLGRVFIKSSKLSASEQSILHMLTVSKMISSSKPVEPCLGAVADGTGSRVH